MLKPNLASPYPCIHCALRLWVAQKIQGSGNARLTHTISISYNELIITAAINPTPAIVLSCNIAR